MKKGILLFCSVVVALLGYSCSSDDNSPIVEEEASLIGEWQLETVDFSNIEENAHPIYQSDFCVMEYIAGYTFKEDGSFIFVVTEDKFGTNSGASRDGEKIWFWEGDTDSFTISQPNPMHTNGYVFAPKEITNIDVRKVGDEWTLTFKAVLHLDSEGTFTLVKKEIEKEMHRPELLDNGMHKEPCALLDR